MKTKPRRHIKKKKELTEQEAEEFLKANMTPHDYHFWELFNRERKGPLDHDEIME